MRFIGVLVLVGALATGIAAQRPRTIDSGPADASKAAPPPAPQTFKAKYEGGVFGYNKAIEGTLTFDDVNRRLLFRNKQQREVLFIPYDAVTSAFADTQKRRPAAATVASSVPIIYALPAHFIKTKVRYLTLQYSDPDTRVSGVTSFRLDNRELLASVLRALAEKAGMTTRGEVYVKKRPEDAAVSP